MAHINIPIRFRFIKIPVTWEVVSGDRLCGRLKKFTAHDQVRVSELDSWQCRDEFFRLPQDDPAQLTEFLNKVGVWSSNSEGLDWSRYPLYVDVENVWQFREDLQIALSRDSRKHFIESVTPVQAKPRTLLDLMAQPAYAGNEFPLSFELSSVAAGVVTLTNARRALFATVLADIARGIRFKPCKRADCGVLFPIVSKHDRQFCSQYCGHLVSLRRTRAKASARKRKANKNQ